MEKKHAEESKGNASAWISIFMQNSQSRHAHFPVRGSGEEKGDLLSFFLFSPTYAAKAEGRNEAGENPSLVSLRLCSLFLLFLFCCVVAGEGAKRRVSRQANNTDEMVSSFWWVGFRKWRALELVSGVRTIDDAPLRLERTNVTAPFEGRSYSLRSHPFPYFLFSNDKSKGPRRRGTNAYLWIRA